MTIKRLLLLLVAIWLASTIFSLVKHIAFTDIWQGLSSPFTPSIADRLHSSDPAVRRLAMKEVDYKNRQLTDIMDALTRIALDDEYPLIQSNAINHLAAMQTVQGTDGKKSPILAQQNIDEVADLVLTDFDKHIRYSLLSFLSNSAAWQTRYQQYIVRLTQLLSNTKDNYDTGRLLQTLTVYARIYPLPAQTFREVLKVYNNDHPQWGHAAREASYVFYGAAHNQRFPPDIQAAIEQALRHHTNRSVRRNAVFTLGNQSRFTGKLSPALHDALKDPYDQVSDKAGWEITLFKQHQGKQQGDSLKSLLDTASDNTQAAEVRARALAQARSAQKGTLPVAVLDTAVELLQDDQSVVRAAAVSYLTAMSQHAAYQQRLDEVHHWLQQALADKHATVRRAGVSQLNHIKLDDKLRHNYIVNMLGDKDNQVVQTALRVVGIKKLDSPEIEYALKALRERQDIAVSNTAQAQLHRLAEQRMSSTEKLVSTATDKESWGGILYFAAAALGILMASVFSIYYAYRLLDNLLQKSWRAATSLVVIIIWTAGTYAMVGLFVVGMFSMGHNTPAPLKDQLAIDGMLLGSVLVYSLAGWLLHFLVRKPKTLS